MTDMRFMEDINNILYSGEVPNILIATNMAAKEKAKDGKYGGFLSAVRLNKSESLVAGKLW